MSGKWTSPLEKKELMDETYDYFTESHASLCSFNMTLTAVFGKLLAEYDVEKMQPKILLQMYFDMLNAEVAAIKTKSTVH